MITARYDNKRKTYTLRRYHNGKNIGIYKTGKIYKKERQEKDLFGSESWNKYIRDNNLQNIKK